MSQGRGQMMGVGCFQLPLDSLSSLLPYTDRKALRYAFYNAVAVVCLVSIMILCIAVCLVLKAFLRPICWALIVGTCLFPCKLMLTIYLRKYLQQQKEKGCLFVLTVALTPVKFFQSTATTFLDALWSKVVPFTIALVSTGVFLFMQESGLFVSLGSLLSRIHYILSIFFSFVSRIFSPRLVAVLAFVYFFVTCTNYIKIPPLQERLLLLFTRFLIFTTLTSFFGVLQPFFIMGAVVLTICAYLFPEAEASHDSNPGNSTTSYEDEVAHFRARCTAAGTLLRRLSLLPESESGDACSQSFSSPQILQMAGGKGHAFPATSGVSDTSNALVRTCFTGLGLVHFAVAFWTRTWLFRLVLVFTSIGLLTYAVASLQLVPGALWLLQRIWISLKFALRSYDSFVMVENSEHSPHLIPASLKASLRWARKIERHIYDFVDNYLDYLVSLVIVSLMVLISLLLTVFLVIQVYNETLHLTSLCSSVLNSTIHSNALSWLPDRDQLGSAARSAVSNVHQLGRSFISSKVNQLFSGNLANKSDIEEQLFELWERVCMQFFHESNAADNLGLHQGVKSNFVLTDDLAGGLNANRTISLTHLRRRLRDLVYSFGGFDYRDIVAYFHENVGIIMNVVNPMWRILSSHASIITSLLMGTISLLFAGGSVVLNLSFSFLIFLSTLFYLLAVSERTYLPVDFVVSLTPQRCEASPAVLSFYASVEAAVASVVVTTLKRTVFYGMYTLLTHTLFGLDVVVLPSIIATILGAIPLVGTYWVVLPGVVELWCLRGSYWLALLLLLLHLLPYSFLDTALYSEIKGAGHPYLTGLSIAGGLYYFGAEGVFIGPVVLCCMLVGVNLYRILLTETTEAGRDGSGSLERPLRIFQKHLLRTPRTSMRYRSRALRARSEDVATLT
ncbi:transmembrane protein C9orf5 [Echinococcus multilocularis]|uniref:Transmembrane protein C9orf5 n=1 Tax=Echinococcus multilocularis TaxID=6211 RepID=A0A087W1G1_ECHMU|nr:transmembrane protein C9orf5 [Echinococcus multilocularis]